MTWNNWTRTRVFDTSWINIWQSYNYQNKRVSDQNHSLNYDCCIDWMFTKPTKIQSLFVPRSRLQDNASFDVNAVALIKRQLYKRDCTLCMYSCWSPHWYVGVRLDVAGGGNRLGGSFPWSGNCLGFLYLPQTGSKAWALHMQYQSIAHQLPKHNKMYQSELECEIRCLPDQAESIRNISWHLIDAISSYSHISKELLQIRYSYNNQYVTAEPKLWDDLESRVFGIWTEQ